MSDVCGLEFRAVLPAQAGMILLVIVAPTGAVVLPAQAGMIP